MTKETSIAAAFEKLGLALTDVQIGQFLRYAELLQEWNKVMNLTAITEFDEIVSKHFADSCAVLLFPERAKLLRRENMIDVGTGAGFPGIPLKIVFPELRLTLLDSLQKRIRFLETVTAELGLKNVCCVHARAEEGARMKQHREQYGLCVSRAVANMSVLAEYTLPYLRTGGLLLAYKSAEIDEELTAAEGAIRLLGGGRPEVEKFVLPATDLHRSLVAVRKIRKTPAVYPRKAGTAAKIPLGTQKSGTVPNHPNKGEAH